MKGEDAFVPVVKYSSMGKSRQRLKVREYVSRKTHNGSLRQLERFKKVGGQINLQTCFMSRVFWLVDELEGGMFYAKDKKC